jgi:hypothetical protein
VSFRLVSFFIILAGLNAFAFPENVRHGYFNCTACHVSPSGGGLLTPYGRALSAEVMSTWGDEKETRFLYSLDNEKVPWFRAGGDLRAVQTRRDTPTVEKGEFIPMQADLELGVDLDKFVGVVTFGKRAKDRTSRDLNEYFSRQHYIMYRASDETNIRAGKFMFSFGLNGPDHITATRRGLGWDQGSESYNLEFSYLAEKHSHYITFISSSPEENAMKRDNGVAISSALSIFENSKVGLSAYYGEQNAYKRYVAGPFWIYSFTKSLFLSSELFYQNKKPLLIDSSSGYATFHRLSYEATKGFFPFIQFDRSYLDTNDSSNRFDSYGIGAQWLPRPHFELMAVVSKEQVADQAPTDFWWLMMHYYL